MARIFSIYFTYDEVLHSAIVSVHTTPVATEYILGNLDMELRGMLPSTLIRASGNELQFQNSSAGQPAELMNAIIKSIRYHLHSENDITKDRSG